MDNNVVSIEKFIQDAENWAEQSCRECALRNGHTTDEAEFCDDGSVGCPDCPFIPRKGK